MRGKSPRRGWDEGATAVEAAITFSLLFSLIFGIADFGMALWQWNTMELAVLQAGRYAMVNNGTITTATAEAQMQVVLPSATVSCPLPSSPAAGTWYICAATQNTGTSPPQTMTLSASYGYNIIGFVGPFKATSQATVPLD
jgi:Flp pilus assembly protein TadG